MNNGVCYHCKQAIPEGSHFFASIAKKKRQFCSKNCLDTAQWIDNKGLSDFYQLRQGQTARPQAEEDLSHWQDPLLQQNVLKQKSDHLYQACLLIDGIHCSGCVWLIERLLLKLGGVSNIQINPLTHRAVLDFDSEKTSLNAILNTIAHAGYKPCPLEPDSINQARQQEHHQLLKCLIVAAFGMMQAMMYAFILYTNGWQPLSPTTSQLFRWLSFLVATPVVFYAARPFFHGAKQALISRALNMDVPIAIAIAAVYLSSVYQAIAMQGEVYFESVSMLVFFLLTGRFLEMRARHHSIDNADALIHLSPSFAQKLLPDGQLETVAVKSLKIGDKVRVMEGAHVPADGFLLSAEALLDEALLSGEANAQKRKKNDEIIAGSLVLQGPIDIELSRVGQDTFLAQLAYLSTQAQAQRPKLSKRSEKATANFVLRVLLFTSLTLLLWLYFDSSHALEATIALLVVACPCALGLAAPAAITRALGVLAQKNVLVVNPDAIESILSIKQVIFDKTGTLTEPCVNTEQQNSLYLQLAASLARESQHPLSKALVAANQAPLLATENCQSMPGLGLQGMVSGRHLRLGQASFALDSEQAEQYANASLVLAENGQLLASFTIDENLRLDAKDTVSQLQKQGIICTILSGDRQDRVASVAKQLDINDYHGQQLPSDKLNFIKQCQQQGRRVLMLGDGSNDAPILAGADLSIALSSGTELAQANADILLCDLKISHLIHIQQIAKQTQTILLQNERWALGYNTLAMPMAALGFIPPWLAAIFMSLSSLFVVLNALRIGNTVKETT